MPGPRLVMGQQCGTQGKALAHDSFATLCELHPILSGEQESGTPLLRRGRGDPRPHWGRAAHTSTCCTALLANAMVLSGGLCHQISRCACQGYSGSGWALRKDSAFNDPQPVRLPGAHTLSGHALAAIPGLSRCLGSGRKA